MYTNPIKYQRAVIMANGDESKIKEMYLKIGGFIEGEEVVKEAVVETVEETTEEVVKPKAKKK